MKQLEQSSITLSSGVRVDYTERGEGPAVIFIHGYTDSWRSFRPVLERMPGSLRALAPSQRGHGDSDRPASGYHISNFAQDVVAFMDATGVTDATVVGHSMGSLVAQQVALSHPQRVSRLVLVGSAERFDNAVVRELAAAVRELRDPIPREFVHEFQASTVQQPVPDEFLATIVNESMKLPARVWYEVLAGMLEFRAGPRLAELAIPTLIVWGEHDAIAPETEQERLHRAIPGSTLLAYEDTGHAPHWEQPERFAGDLVAFIEATSPVRAKQRVGGAGR